MTENTYCPHVSCLIQPDTRSVARTIDSGSSIKPTVTERGHTTTIRLRSGYIHVITHVEAVHTRRMHRKTAETVDISVLKSIQR